VLDRASTDPFSERGAGLLLHPTSLPGPGPIGDLGPAARAFARFLASAGLRWWQMLPIGPVGAGHSPYQSFSSFAGDERLLSLEDLAEEGLLDPADLLGAAPKRPDRLDPEDVARFKEPRLRAAFERFEARAAARPREEIEAFREANRSWLEDYALFRAIKEVRGGSPWSAWPRDLRLRDPGAIAMARERLAREIRYRVFLQWTFHLQWRRLREECARLGVLLLGDLPIFVARDSADVWAHREIFKLEDRGRPLVVAGVPPDYFSRTGQRWGNPLYRWDVLRARGYDRWIERLRATFERFDAVRLDHFIGFVRTWEIPASSKTALRGSWREGPGADFFEAALAAVGRLPILAEDLGLVTEEVRSLRDRFGFPGMRVLQFGFGGDPRENEHHPRNHPRHCVVYTGTHDNDTIVGWFREAPRRSPRRTRSEILAEREAALREAGTDGREIHWDIIRLAFASRADTAIVPVQDVLGLGSEARMNRPGTKKGNWLWRLEEGALTDEVAARLRALAAEHGRLSMDPT
jgi:4-alpha-glucanotransferase